MELFLADEWCAVCSSAADESSNSVTCDLWVDYMSPLHHIIIASDRSFDQMVHQSTADGHVTVSFISDVILEWNRI